MNQPAPGTGHLGSVDCWCSGGEVARWSSLYHFSGAGKLPERANLLAPQESGGRERNLRMTCLQVSVGLRLPDWIKPGRKTRRVEEHEYVDLYWKFEVPKEAVQSLDPRSDQKSSNNQSCTDMFDRKFVNIHLWLNSQNEAVEADSDDNDDVHCHPEEERVPDGQEGGKERLAEEGSYSPKKVEDQYMRRIARDSRLVFGHYDQRDRYCSSSLPPTVITKPPISSSCCYSSLSSLV